MIKSAINLFTGHHEPIIRLKRAVDGISLTFEKGDRIALIGKNGSGKSTLLRILSGIYHPTGGTLSSRGKISSLLDISVGLNIDATGYENIILMGILHGKTRKQMRAKFADIEEFTELKDYLKLPVRTYSNGMKLRLAFGIATCIESDIIILDEVVGVGDQNYMQKAQKRLQDLVHNSQILILASHFTQVLENFCNKSLVLDQGKCLFWGDLQKGIELYHKLPTVTG
ncbi:MAG: ABC transporter ATP-binding protein [Verrucomicrobia bacterium]|nr:ABC transporter ATP-binding protein [Verrucomicrobiota bacterium]